MAKRHKYCWRNKSAGDDAESIGELVAALRKAAADLEKMARAGIVLGSSDGDYFFLTTEDRKLADRFGCEPELEENRRWATCRAMKNLSQITKTWRRWIATTVALPRLAKSAPIAGDMP